MQTPKRTIELAYHARVSPYPDQPDPWNDPPADEPQTPPNWPEQPGQPGPSPLLDPETDTAGHADNPSHGNWPPADSGPPTSSHLLRRIVAWLLILGSAAALFVEQADSMDQLAKQAEDDPRPGYTALYLARYAVGMDQLSFAKDQAGGMQHSFDAITAESPHVEASQLRGAILAGDLIGRDEAQDRLTGLESLDGFVFYPDADVQPEFSRDLITRIYTDAGFVPSPAQRDKLIDQHGWFGELAAGYNLPPSDPLLKAPASRPSGCSLVSSE